MPDNTLLGELFQVLPAGRDLGWVKRATPTRRPARVRYCAALLVRDVVYQVSRRSRLRSHS